MCEQVDVEKIMEADCPETAETMGFRLSTEYATQVMLEVKRRGMKLKDLASLMGVSQATLSRMLSSTSNMTMKTVARLAVALGCDAEAPRLLPTTDDAASNVVRFVAGSERGRAGLVNEKAPEL